MNQNMLALYTSEIETFVFVSTKVEMADKGWILDSEQVDVVHMGGKW